MLDLEIIVLYTQCTNQNIKDIACSCFQYCFTLLPRALKKKVWIEKKNGQLLIRHLLVLKKLLNILKASWNCEILSLVFLKEILLVQLQHKNFWKDQSLMNYLP